MAAQIALTQAMVYTDGRTIVDDIGEELHQAASQILDAHGLPAEMFLHFKPFMWQQMLLALALEQSGLTAEDGLDMYFLHRAAEIGMPIIEMESLEMQTELFNNFSIPLHVYLIENSLDIPLAAEGIRLLYEAWQRGNEAEILALLAADYEGMPGDLQEEFTNAMLLYRDIDMAAKARELMQEGQKVFFVAGLAHFVGQDSIVDILKNYGYTVEVITPQ